MAQELISEIKFQLHGLQHTVAFGDHVFSKVNDLNSTIVVKKKKVICTHPSFKYFLLLVPL